MSDVSLIKYCMLLVQNFDFKSLLELCGILSVKYAKFVTDFRQGCQGLLTITAYWRKPDFTLLQYHKAGC